MCARLVEKKAQHPREIETLDGSVWVCMCGLSKNQPFCDGSHKKTIGEADGKVYQYDLHGHRHEVKKAGA